MLKDVEKTIGEINRVLQEATRSGSPFTANLSAAPSHCIESLEPLSVQRYGRLRNRAPKLSGPVALAALVKVEHPEASLHAVCIDADATMHIAPVTMDMINDAISLPANAAMDRQA